MSDLNEPTYQLRRLLVMPGSTDILRRHRWSHEGDRWQELVTAMLCECLTLPPTGVATLTRHLRSLKLLAPETWADVPKRRPDSLQSETWQRALAVFLEHEVSDKEANQGVAVVYELARYSNTKYSGRVQKALKEAGDALLSSLEDAVHLDALAGNLTRRALAVWLQNVTSLPVSLQAPSMTEFCKKHGFSADELAAAADEENVNRAALDDLVEYWSRTQKKKATKR